MADCPILFSAPMVQALLREAHQPGTGKTQTRRILTRLSKVGAVTEFGPSDTAGYDWHFRDKAMRWHDLRDVEMKARLPWQVGDRLWVRESWRTLQKVDCLKPRDLADDRSKVTYEADPENRNPLWAFGKLRPSLFMPRWASRLTLLVTDVRVERLQDISEGDAAAEGVELESADPPFHYVPGIWPHSITAVGVEEPGGRHAARSFAKLWGHINGPESWQANPWVVAVTFSVHARNIDQLAPIAEAAE